VPDFATFVLEHLPPPPRRVLEIGCGRAGGLVELLAGAGYDAIGVDPQAPEGTRFRRVEFQELDGEFDAAVAGRVLHHVRPLGESLDRLAELAQLVLVDEFAWDRIDDAAQDWYEGQHRLLRAAGVEPYGPGDLDEWRLRHPGLHRHGVLLAGLRARFEERRLEWVPYFHRWLGGPSSEALEQTLTDAGAFPAIGWRWAGTGP
jgi:hypothetical protein